MHNEQVHQTDFVIETGNIDLRMNETEFVLVLPKPNETLNMSLFSQQFMLRQEVLKLYRDIFRSIRVVPELSSRNDLKEWTRSDFRANMHHTDELTVKMLLQHGQRSLNELKTSLELSGIKDAADKEKSSTNKINNTINDPVAK